MNPKITSEWTAVGYCSLQAYLAEEEMIAPMWSVAKTNFLYR